MDAETQLTGWLIAARAVHFGACLLAFGAVAFDRWIAAPVLKDDPASIATRWPRSIARMVGWSLALALISGAAWFALNAIAMSGLAPSEALKADVLRVVLTDTHFGKLWALRASLWIATLITIGIARFAPRLSSRKPSLLAATVRSDRDVSPLQAEAAFTGRTAKSAIEGVVLLLLTAALAGSLAWAGHGTEGNAPNVHLAADLLHILIGGLWPAGLLPFVLLLGQLRRADGSEKWRMIAAATRRFSAMSLTSVVLLAGTGLLSGLLLVGAPSDLITTPYGKTLTAKVTVFLAMVALGATNLLRWKPRLSPTGDDRTAHAAARLRINVALELALGAIVLAIVGLLGILPPAIHAAAHAHHH